MPKNKKRKIIFFSRGRGRGHAFPDMQIADEFLKLNPDLDLVFVSYSTGAETFRAAGREVLDLELREENDFLVTLVKAHEIIQRLRPDCVFSHEEFAVLPASRLGRTPCILISTWIPPTFLTPAFSSLAYCDRIVLLERAGLFYLPQGMRDITTFTGPVVRKMSYTVEHRATIRRDLGISDDCFLVCVAPGGFGTEARIPIAHLVFDAFDKLPGDKHMYWVSAHDRADLLKRAQGLSTVTVLGYYDCIEKLFSASDVVITKGTYGTVMETSSLGIPSISLSGQINPIDDMLVPRIKSNVALIASATDPELLAHELANVMRARKAGKPLAASNLHLLGYEEVARHLTNAVRAFRRS